MKEGLKEGIAQRNIEIAKSMLSLNLPIAQIVQVTGLAEDNIKGNVKVQKLLHSLFSFYVSFAITLFAYVIMP